MIRTLRATRVSAAVGLALLGALPAFAASQAQAQAQAPAAAAPGHRTAKGVGVITEIDAAQAMVTLRHEPIPTLGWPTMVMPFRVTPPGLLTGLKVGQKVAFETREAEGLPEITAIHKR